MFAKFRGLALLTLILFSSAPTTHAEWNDGSSIYCRVMDYTKSENKFIITLGYYTKPEAVYNNLVKCSQKSESSSLFACEIGYSNNKGFSYDRPSPEVNLSVQSQNDITDDQLCQPVKTAFNLSVPQ